MLRYQNIGLDLLASVADPDPMDPYVFGPPEVRVRIQILLTSSKNIRSKKNLNSYCFVNSS